VSVRDIRSSIPVTVCEVCGRTLLRGETPQVFLDGGARRSVCELCTARAAGAGWVREGTEVPDDPRQVSERHESLFARLRRRGAATPGPAPEDITPDQPPTEAPQPPPAGRRGWLGWLRSRDPGRGSFFPDAADDDLSARPAVGSGDEPPGVSAAGSSSDPQLSTSDGQQNEQAAARRLAAAVEAFNRSEHRRTVAGVGRSLGMPTVSVREVDASPEVVAVVVSWELCWYRYEVDFSAEDPGVAMAGQGWELSELPDVERAANAVADETGALRLAD
jgi:hypothetical protein